MSEAQQFNIKVPRMARFFLSGRLKKETNHIVIVFHGYAQLAKYFIRKFEHLTADDRVIVAPEGIHRFYVNGGYGKVVASWMTKEDRSADIETNNVFLNELINKLKMKSPNAVITLLGFSQGATTVTRWITQCNPPVNNLIIWAGSLPHDSEISNLQASLKKLDRLILVRGDQDEIFSEENFKSIVAVFNHLKNFTSFSFPGNHAINSLAFDTIMTKIFD